MFCLIGQFTNLAIITIPFPVQNGSSSVQNGNSSVQNGKIIISINIKNIL